LKKKITLHSSFEIPDYGIGFSTSMVDYRLAWEVNQKININLVKLSDKIFHEKKTGKEVELSVYYFKNGESGKLFIIKLKYEGISIIPGLKQFDYILISESSVEEIKQLFSDLTGMNIQGGCFLIQFNENWKTVLRKIIY
jgi:hypothetical protein